MSKRAKLTDWFNIARHGQPPIKGWYDVSYFAEPKCNPCRRYWSGRDWRYAPDSARCSFGNVRADWKRESWRGLAEDPNKGA